MQLVPKMGQDGTASLINLKITYKKYAGLTDIVLNPVLSFKSQLLLKYSKDLPVFENEYLGGEGFVRGYSPVVQDNPGEVQNRIEGIHIIYQNIQLQHTLIEKRDYRGLEFGMDMAYFADLGISSQSLSSFRIANRIIGYGLGIRLFLSGAGVISIDLGYNPYGSWFVHPSDGDY